MFSHTKKYNRGFSFIEVIVASAIFTLFFGGLFAGVQLMIGTIGYSKAQAAARSLALSKMEYIRSLPYEDIGTIAGIPSGPIPQNSTTTLNGIVFTERVLIQYLDREEDGFGVADSNGITEDSKRIKVDYSWDIRGQVYTMSLISDVVPVGIESTSGGGTLHINVFDASVLPVPGATVHIFNDSVATDTIDVTVTTNASGFANFPGAPARSGYQITVTKAGYSTDQTYSASTTNPSPNPSHISVAVGLVSTAYFSIDELSDLTLRSIATPTRGLYSDSFSDVLGIASSSNVVIGGDVRLTDTGGVYDSSGFAFATSVVPTTISSWEAIDFNGTSTLDSEYRVRLYYPVPVGTTTIDYELVPDSALANNSVGFVLGPIDITSIDPATYPELVLGAELTTSDTSLTPILYDWSLSYIIDETPIPGVQFSIKSTKTIGNNLGVPVPKFETTVVTDGSGDVTLPNIEWDAYYITVDGAVEGYNISETFAPLPYGLLPGVSDTLTLVLEPHSAYSLRATVVDIAGNPIPGASVHLHNGTVDETQETSIYGQVFFGSVSSSTNYTIDTTAFGYDPDNQTNFPITGNVETTIIMAVAGSGTGTSTPTTTPPTVSNFLAGYNNRIPLSISGGSLYGSVTDFPVYLDMSDLPSTFFTGVQSDGDDIRVTQGDGLTEVPFELVSINTTSETGQLYFKAPSLSIATTTNFYIYYGNATATPYATTHTYGRNNVWTNGFLAVYHLEEAQSGSGNADIYKDSTGNGYDGDDYINATNKTGKLGQGQSFSAGSTDWIELPYTLLNNRTNLTVSFWYRTGTNDYMTILSGARSGQANEYLLWFKDRNEMEFFSHGDPRVNFDIMNINDDVWRHYVSVRDDSNNQTRLYINGVEDNQSPASDSMTTLNIASGGLFIGVDQDSVGGSFDQYLDGELDEFRIEDGVRSSSWISNVYLNQNSPTSFYSIGTIETE